MKKSLKFKTEFTDSLTEYKSKKLIDEISKPNQTNSKKYKFNSLASSKQKISNIEIQDIQPTFSKILNESFIKNSAATSARFIDKKLVNKINLDTKIKKCKNLLTNKSKKKSVFKETNNKLDDKIKIIKLKNGKKLRTIFRNIKYNINKNSLRSVLDSSYIEKIKNSNNIFNDLKTKSITPKRYMKKVYKRKKCGFYKSMSVKKEKENLFKLINISFNSTLNIENNELCINNGFVLLEKFLEKQKKILLSELFEKFKFKIKEKKLNKEQCCENKRFYVKKEQYDLLKVLKNRKIKNMDDLKKYIIIMYGQNVKYEI